MPRHQNLSGSAPLDEPERRRLEKQLRIRKQYRENLLDMKGLLLRAYDSGQYTLADLTDAGGFRHRDVLRLLLRRTRAALLTGQELEETE